MSSPVIRHARPADTAAMLRIYAPMVETSVASFELQAPSLQAFQARVDNAQAHHCWLVIEVRRQTVAPSHY